VGGQEVVSQVIEVRQGLVKVHPLTQERICGGQRTTSQRSRSPYTSRPVGQPVVVAVIDVPGNIVFTQLIIDSTRQEYENSP